jgi:hypothetical protein
VIGLLFVSKNIQMLFHKVLGILVELSKAKVLFIILKAKSLFSKSHNNWNLFCAVLIE